MAAGPADGDPVAVLRAWRGQRTTKTLVVLVAIAGLTACTQSTPAVQAKRPATGRGPSAQPVPVPVASHALLHVAPQSQLPALPNGCEVTSLSMLLAAVGYRVDNLTLAALQPTNSAQPIFGPRGHLFSDIVRWGDPNDSFVGAVAGHRYGIGYGIYHRPLTRLADHLLPGRAIDLTGRPFDDVLAQVANGTPVVTWVTSQFKPTDNWVTWAGPHGPVHATEDEHTVLLVGFDRQYVYVNNPLTNSAGQRLNRDLFVSSWKQLGRQALSITQAGARIPTPT